MKKEMRKMEKEMKFMTFGREIIPNLNEHVEQFLKDDPYSIVAVGTDSKQLKNHTMYVIAIAMYNPFLMRGSHVVFHRFKIEKQKDLFTRLFKEAEFSLNIAESIHTHLEKCNYTRKDLKDHEQHFKLVDIHVDFNPLPGPKGTWKSYPVYNAAVPWLKGQDFRVYGKPSSSSWVASCAADLLMKKRK